MTDRKARIIFLKTTLRLLGPQAASPALASPTVMPRPYNLFAVKTSTVPTSPPDHVGSDCVCVYYCVDSVEAAEVKTRKDRPNGQTFSDKIIIIDASAHFPETLAPPKEPSNACWQLQAKCTDPKDESDAPGQPDDKQEDTPGAEEAQDAGSWLHPTAAAAFDDKDDDTDNAYTITYAHTHTHTTTHTHTRKKYEPDTHRML